MGKLYEWLKQAAENTEWHTWMREIFSEIEQMDLSHVETWTPLERRSRNHDAMRWLIRQLRQYDPLPPEEHRQEAALWILMAFCPDNSVLGYLIDTWQYYYRTKDAHGVLSYVRILSLVNRHDEYSHLNVLYNLIMGDVLREYRLYVAPSDKRSVSPFLSERDFHILGKCLPDFRSFGFREQVQVAQNKMTGTTTSEELARACCMSGSVFRKRFKEEFGIPVSEWLRQQRKQRIKRMLGDRDIPLWQIAESNGFNMASTFSDYCRRNFGEPPLQIRKKLSE